MAESNLKRYEYLRNENGVLYCADCLTIFPELEPVDLVLTDPPYGTTKNKWDSVIPLYLLWNGYGCVSKKNAAVVLFGDGLFTADCMKSNQKEWRYNLIWKKADRTSGFLNANKMPLRNHEDIMVFYKTPPTYNPQFSKGYGPSHKKGKFGVLNEKNNCYGKFQVLETRNYSDKKFPKSILTFDRDMPSIYPTQKPIALFEYLIRTYTNKGEIVLDSCAGSGTSAIACERQGRKWILIEKLESACAIAAKRIQHETQQLKLFG